MLRVRREVIKNLQVLFLEHTKSLRNEDLGVLSQVVVSAVMGVIDVQLLDETQGLSVDKLKRELFFLASTYLRGERFFAEKRENEVFSKGE